MELRYSNFKLLDSGEEIILSKGSTVLDSISFGFKVLIFLLVVVLMELGAFGTTNFPVI